MKSVERLRQHLASRIQGIVSGISYQKKLHLSMTRGWNEGEKLEREMLDFQQMFETQVANYSSLLEQETVGMDLPERPEMSNQQPQAPSPVS